MVSNEGTLEVDEEALKSVSEGAESPTEDQSGNENVSVEVASRATDSPPSASNFVDFQQQYWTS